ncbi:MAG: transglutaminaseTgpA domain-containing protein [Kangiellaceae bacterium]|nr:transglutaminaseTgpA domain-containing protein [Kangiellaceae bacterium]MCW9000719.1 transglutaminaseTgpA domain-containing protein [Kangiellaceae bacterium]MCW9017760.1 transglutaminaseTgpA domain-containing protein [Kangiellaceae bacterium]
MNAQSLTQQQLVSRPLPLKEIIVAQQLVLFPLYFFIPFWIILLNLLVSGTVFWASQKNEFRVPRWFKVAITTAAVLGVFIAFRKISGRDAGVALISAMYGLKILETYKLRDAHLLLNLGFFMLVAGFLFNQDPLIAVYQFVPVIALLNAYTSLYRVNTDDKSGFSLRSILSSLGKYLLLAIPLMLILFVFFPRLAGPLWRMPGSSEAVSGISDTMSPGEISSLQLFDKIAFRATFESSPPNENDLYWRVLSLDKFDGMAWTREGANPLNQIPLTEQQIKFDYTITMEETQRNFLISLDRPVKTQGRSFILEDFTVYSPFRIIDRLRYSMQSAPNLEIGTRLSSPKKEFYLSLPEGNEMTKNWSIVEREKYSDDRAFINSVLTRINQQEYFYTLSPPSFDEDIVDNFWLGAQRGFCEHYASALVFIARAAGIPARVVVGYQGGEKNPLSDYWIVRYANAHAWTELWFEGEGWVRLDPTAAIAEERVESELLSDYSQRLSLFDEFSVVNLDDLGMLKQIEYWVDQMNTNWNDWVLDFNRQRQSNLLSKLGLSGIKPQQMIGIIFVAISVFVLVIAIRSFRKRDVLSPYDREFTKLLSKLNKALGVELPKNIGPYKLLNIISQSSLEDKSKYKNLLESYIQYRYAEKPSSANNRRKVLTSFKRLNGYFS